MKVAVLFDGASALGKAPDLLILDAVEAIERALALEGNTVARVAVTPDGRWLERLRRPKFDLVFNLCEGVDGVAALEPSVIAAIELLGVPYTGSSSWTTAVCLRKDIVNGLLDRAGLPVPRWGLVHPGASAPIVGFPAICKPAAEDASLGVEQRSVVRTARALSARIDAMHERWNDVVVQHYVDGRELNVGILGDQVLPVAEIDFGGMPKGMWRIVSYRSKWESGSDEDSGAAPLCPAPIDPALAREVQGIAVAAWRAVGGSGYGRCDFRVDRHGRPWLLEVNANPDLSPDAGMARMAHAAGLDYSALVLAICEIARRRFRTAGPATDRWTLAQRLSGVALAGEDEALDLFAMGQR